MRTLIVSLVLLVGGGLAQADGLAKIERKIATLPTFSAEVQYYALLVLGAEQEKRVWLVIDDHDLYVDKNGNGDLTEEGERLQAPRKVGRSDFITSRSWGVAEFDESGRYSDFRVHLGLVNPSWRPAKTASNRQRMEAFMAVVRKTPHANLTSIYLTIDGKRTQLCSTMFGVTPETAPVLHMDGPLTLGLVESFAGFRFWRGAEQKLTVAVGTRGHGPATFSYAMYAELPEEARPVLEIEFPGAEPGTYLPKRMIELTQRC